MSRARIIGVLCLVTVCAVGALRAQAPGAPLSAPEQQAIDVVRGWIGGWEAKDPALVGSFMDEDVFWSGGFPNNPFNGIWRGRDRFIQQDGGATLGGVKFRVLDELAIGGPAGTAVLHRRTDEGGFGPYMGLGGRGGGPGVFFVNAVFYWVADGRIRVWLDGPVTFPPVPRDQAPPMDSWRAEEQAALALVNQWVAAWNAKDADRVASYMGEDVEFNTNLPRQIAEIGRDHFLRTRREAITAGVQMRVGESLAVGGSRGTAVLIRRTDRLTVQGRQQERATAAFFWIENGRIRLWYDTPLDTPPDTSRAGARPAPAAPPGGTARDARSLIDAAQQAMGIRGVTAFALTANGRMADTAEAWGGNAAQPVVQAYEAAFDLTLPAMRLRIVRTNPDGTALRHGTEELEFLSGNTAWDQPPASRGAAPPPGGAPGPAPAPGAAGPPAGAPPAGGPPAGGAGRRGGGPPGPGRGGPVLRTASAVSTRRMQVLLTPPGFLAAASQYAATVRGQGDNRAVTFTTPEGQRYEGRLDRAGRLTRIATIQPVTNVPVDVAFSTYRTFNGVSYPSRIVQTEGSADVVNLTVTDVRPGERPNVTAPPQAVR